MTARVPAESTSRASRLAYRLRLGALGAAGKTLRMARRPALVGVVLAIAGLPAALAEGPTAEVTGDGKPQAGSDWVHRDPDSTPTKRVPKLGTATTQATAEERAAAGLPQGIGLVIRHVVEGSPAAGAGLEAGDVLHKLNDQILVNDPQFRVVLRTFAPGEEVQFTLIREGRPRTVTVRLGEARVPVSEVPAREMLRWLLMPPDAPARSLVPAEYAARYEDDQHTLLLASDAQGKWLLVRDKRGNVLFKGAVDSQAQRRALPESIRAKLEVLESPPEAPPKAPGAGGEKPGSTRQPRQKTPGET